MRRQFLVKLKSLYVKKYKNLSPLTIDFEAGNGLTMLVGNNGSGKSNVLEAISGIFHDLFKEKDGRKITCEYKLEYNLNDINCVIEQTNGTLRCYGEKFKRRDNFIEENAPNIGKLMEWNITEIFLQNADIGKFMSFITEVQIVHCFNAI